MNVKYVICVNNEGHRDSLEVRKVYLMLPDDGEPDFGLVRVIDESGEDYLYPADRFVTADLTEEGVRAVFAVVL